MDEDLLAIHGFRFMRWGIIHKSPSQRYGSLRTDGSRCCRSYRRGRMAKRKSLTSFSRRRCDNPGTGMQRARTFNITVKIVPGPLSTPMRERETISRAREPWLR